MSFEVSVVKCKKYEIDEVIESIERALEGFGGLKSFINRGEKVLLKANFVLAKPVSFACNTNPAFIYAVAELVQRLGAHPYVGDSPALGTAESVAKKMDMLDELSKRNIPLINLKSAGKSESKAANCKLKVATEIESFDKIINLPKLKAHRQAGITACVKNLYGCVTGRHKAWLHCKFGHTENRFLQMLLDTANVVQPHLNIVDGIIALEGEGPINGDPLEVGAIFAGANPIAIDTVICEHLHAKPDSILLHKFLQDKELEESKLSNIEVLDIDHIIYSLPKIKTVEELISFSFSPWHIFIGYTKQLKKHFLKR